MKTAIISSETSKNHFTGDGHPEQPKRVIVITEKLKNLENSHAAKRKNNAMNIWVKRDDAKNNIKPSKAKDIIPVSTLSLIISDRFYSISLSVWPKRLSVVLNCCKNSSK